MRFIYDLKTGMKKKNKSRIEIPLEINMKPFINNQENIETNYKLFAVLIHKGISAYGGKKNNKYIISFIN